MKVLLVLLLVLLGMVALAVSNPFFKKKEKGEPKLHRGWGYDGWGYKGK